jgi:crotonobetainyl-CoA:carnitine CoA-transferase CaiB-like acyl-CoA transferase
VLSDAGVPCGRVREVGEAISLPHLEARNLKLPLNVPGLPQPVSVLNAGFCLSGDGPHVDVPPPRLDEHRDEILRWLASS